MKCEEHGDVNCGACRAMAELEAAHAEINRNERDGPDEQIMKFFCQVVLLLAVLYTLVWS